MQNEFNFLALKINKFRQILSYEALEMMEQFMSIKKANKLQTNGKHFIQKITSTIIVNSIIHFD